MNQRLPSCTLRSKEGGASILLFLLTLRGNREQGSLWVKTGSQFLTSIVLAPQMTVYSTPISSREVRQMKTLICIGMVYLGMPFLLCNEQAKETISAEGCTQRMSMQVVIKCRRIRAEKENAMGRRGLSSPKQYIPREGSTDACC